MTVLLLSNVRAIERWYCADSEHQTVRSSIQECGESCVLQDEMACFSIVCLLILFSTCSLFQPCSGATAIPSCSLDVAFLVDSSGSVKKEYRKEKHFVKEMATYLGIPNQSYGAVIIFSTDAEISVGLEEAKNLSHFKRLVDKIRFLNENTRIDKALKLAAKNVFPKARPNVVKVALVLTDGKQTDAPGVSLTNTSQSLHVMGVRVIAVGIGKNIKESELFQMVQTPRDVVLVSDFDSLVQKAQEISQYLCNISKPTRYPTANRQTYNSNHTCMKNLNVFVKSFIERIDLLNHKDQHSFENATFLLADLINILKNQSTSIKGSDVMCFVLSLEEFTFRYAEHFLKTSTTKRIYLENDKAVLHAQLIPSNSSNDYVFPNSNFSQNSVAVVLPKENFKENDSIVVSLLYKDLHLYLKEMSFNLSKKKLGTKVLSLSVKPKVNRLQKNVKLRFESTISNSPDLKIQPDCVYWDYVKSSERVSGWSTKGCSLSKNDNKMTECTCNHLTHFAVLMQVHAESISNHNKRILSIITYVGLALSLIGCLLTIILHFAFVNVKAHLSQIHLNLVISIAIGQITFIFGINATDNPTGCACVAALIQYFYLVAFCWMLIEGIQLYLRIVKVFNIEGGMLANYMFAWGFPLVVVTATIGAALTSKEGVAGFVHQEFCWLSFRNKLAWTFVGPVLCITLINTVLLLHVIREMSRMDKAAVGSTPQLDVMRKTAKACAVLFPLLGVTWLFGVLTMSEVGVAAQYIFTILNSTQGFLIFLFNCVRNTEIRTKVVAKLRYFYSPKTPSITPTPQEKPVPPQQKKNIIKTAFVDRHPTTPARKDKSKNNCSNKI